MSYEDGLPDLQAILADRRLASYMNDTKWQALCDAVHNDLPFPQAYQEMKLWDSKANPDDLPWLPNWYGSWSTVPTPEEGKLGLETEWIRVSPRLRHHRGQLIPQAVEDCSDQFQQILERLRIPYVLNEGFFTIYGHANGNPF